MALNAGSLVVMSNAWIAAYPYLALHTTGAVTSSASTATSARVAAAWAVNGSGVITSTNKAFTGGAASGPCVRVGYWSASTGGTYGGGSLLTGDQSFNASGEYTVTAITETPTST